MFHPLFSKIFTFLNVSALRPFSSSQPLRSLRCVSPSSRWLPLPRSPSSLRSPPDSPTIISTISLPALRLLLVLQDRPTSSRTVHAAKPAPTSSLARVRPLPPDLATSTDFSRQLTPTPVLATLLPLRLLARLVSATTPRSRSAFASPSTARAAAATISATTPTSETVRPSSPAHRTILISSPTAKNFCHPVW